MANIDSPVGLVPVRNIDGSPWNGATTMVYVPDTDNTAIYIGGLVKLAGSADADGVPSVTGNVSTGDAVYGVVVGVDSVTEDSLVYRAASTARYLHVCLANNALFKVQDDAAGAPAATDVGSVADLTGLTSGDTIYGRSSIEISYATVTASGDGTEDVQIMGLWRAPNNSIGDNADWLVRLNNIQLVPDSAGV